jgi:hypothetical protein
MVEAGKAGLPELALTVLAHFAQKVMGVDRVVHPLISVSEKNR